VVIWQMAVVAQA